MSKSISLYFTFFTALLGIILASIFIQGTSMMNGNLAWLLIGAERLLDGRLMSQDFFETNPPYSMIIYMPFIMISRILDIPIADISYHIGLALSLLSLAVTWKIIEKHQTLHTHIKLSVILAYAISLTLLQGIFFSDKEHMIIFGLIPFILYQFSYNQGIRFNFLLTVLVMIMGCVSIFIKPHYGLIATLFILHRVFKTQKLKSVIAPDFISLSIATILYSVVLIVFFQDFIHNILPVTLEYYVSRDYSKIELLRNALYAIIFSILTMLDLSSAKYHNEESKKLHRALYFSAFICLMMFFIQQKGLFIHLIPAVTLSLLALSISLPLHITDVFKNKNFSGLVTVIPEISVFILIISFLPLSLAKKSDIHDLSIGVYLKNNCEAPCPFTLLGPHTRVFIASALHNESYYASRFPFYWMLSPLLIDISKNPPDSEKYIAAKHTEEKLKEMVAEDIMRHKPKLIFVEKFKSSEIDDENFTYVSYFSENPKFKEEINNSYSLVDPLILNVKNYYPAEPEQNFTFEVYKRKNEAQNR